MGLEGRLLGGRYRIRHLLGSGGMGAVYAAEQEDLRKQVAVKVLLHEQEITPTDLARFKQEALAAAKLGHPNIVQVTDFQVWRDEPPLLVMEMLEGESLHARLARAGRLEPERAIFIMKQVLAALAAAHAAGIVHRDIKPANIFLTETPAMADLVKVLDFGIAKVPGLTRGFVTAPGAILGTPAYMAPEQVRAGTGDHRIDLYAVGVCLFEMLVGRRPYPARTFAELMEALKTESPPVRSVAPEIDAKLADVIDRSLRHDPRHRPQRAIEMLDSLAGGRDGATIVTAQPIAAPSTKSFTLVSKVEDAPSASSAPTTEVNRFVPSGATAPIDVQQPPRPLGAVRARRPSSPSDDELAAKAWQSLFWSVGGFLVMCFPLGIVGIVMGLRARSLAMRAVVPTPIAAVLAIVLGTLGSLASLVAMGFSSWVLIDLQRDKAAVAARIAAIERSAGDAASAQELDRATACSLAEVFVLRNGVNGINGWQVERVECRGAITRSPDTAALGDVKVSTRTARLDLNVCFIRAQTWVVVDVQKEPCPKPK